MKRLTCLTCALFLAVLGCKKAEQPAEPTEKVKPAEPLPPPEPPKPVPLTGAALYKAYEDCHLAAANAHDMAKGKTCWTSDASLAMAGMPEATGEAIGEHFAHFVAAFPDLKIEPVIVLVNGQTIASVVRMSGTNSGPLMNMPATNKPFALLGLAVDDVDDQGKIKHATHILDVPTMMGQIGATKGKFRPLAEPAGEKQVVIASDSQAERDNVALVQKWGDAFAKGDMKAAAAFMADDVVITDMGMPADMKGAKEIEKTMAVMMKAFPDGKWSTSNRIAAGDYVLSQGNFTGTNKGPMPGFIEKPTGKTVNTMGAELVLVQGGKVKHVWWFGNGAEMAQQLGLMPPPGEKAGAPGEKAPAEKAAPAEKTK